MGGGYPPKKSTEGMSASDRQVGNDEDNELMHIAGMDLPGEIMVDSASMIIIFYYSSGGPDYYTLDSPSYF